MLSQYLKISPSSSIVVNGISGPYAAGASRTFKMDQPGGESKRLTGKSALRGSRFGQVTSASRGELLFRTEVFLALESGQAKPLWLPRSCDHLLGSLMEIIPWIPTEKDHKMAIGELHRPRLVVPAVGEASERQINQPIELPHAHVLLDTLCDRLVRHV